ncbi:hypothetical protein BJ170DRAFT_684383 [Xylariales sp. AK1849]|nr:hypothetical protein BJ170DRAFT_684383 [Xylariales sp. AK1849]
MAESKNKSMINGAGRQPKDSSKIWTFLSSAKDIINDFEGIHSLASLVEEKNKLQKELEVKAKENEELQRQQTQAMKVLDNLKAQALKEREIITNAFGERYKAFDQKNAIMERQEREIIQLKADLQGVKSQEAQRQDRVKKLEAGLKDANAAKLRHESASKSKENECIHFQAQLKACELNRDNYRSKLQQAKAELGDGILKEMNESIKADLTRELKLLSDKCHSVVMAIFTDQVLPKNATISVAHLRRQFTQLPLSGDCTKEAVLMRCAAAEAIIAQALLTHVFRPFYVLDGPEGNMIAPEVVLDLFSADKRRQSIYRYQLLKMIEDDDVGSGTEAVVAVASNFIHGALDQLVSPPKLTLFHDQIEDLLQNASDTWFTYAQLSQDLVTADMPTIDDNHLESRVEYGTRSESVNSGNTKRTIVAPLFPRISINGSGAIPHHGTVLWLDQPAVLAAKTQLPLHEVAANGLQRRSGRRTSVSLG